VGLDDHILETQRLIAEQHRYAALIAFSDDNVPVGFAEAAVRHDYVNGCKTSPVLFLEGIYVLPDARRAGIARALCAAIGQWGSAHACTEFGSDTQIDNVYAQALHRALGFEETERVVFFRKRLSR
jgi:aminoglycoside 6'-N-acetyltransferase I